MAERLAEIRVREADNGSSAAAPGEGVLTAGTLERHAVHGALWTAMHTMTSMPLAFAANAIVARVLGAADYGQLAVLTLVMSVAVQLTNMGVSDGVSQWGAAAHARGQRREVDSLLRRSLGFHLAVQLPFLVLVVLLLARDAPPVVTAALLMSVVIPASLGSAALAITIENKTAGAAKLSMVSNLIVQVGIALVAVATHAPNHVWATRSIAGSLLLPANFLLLDRARRRIALKPALPRHMPSGFWRFAIFTSIGGIVGMLVFSRSELVLLQALDTATAAGLFALAFGLAQQVTAPVDAMLGPLTPAVAGIAAAHPERSTDAVLRATRVGALLSAAIVCIASPGIYFLIPAIYGSTFEPAAPLFLILAGISCLQSLINPLLAMARARLRGGYLLRLNIQALAVDVLLAVSLIPVLGVYGALAANAAGQLAVLLPLARSEARNLKIPTRHYLQATSVFGTAVVAALATVAILAAAPLQPLIQAALAPPLGIAALLLLGKPLISCIPESDLQPGLAALPRPVAKVARLAVAPFMAPV